MKNRVKQNLQSEMFYLLNGLNNVHRTASVEVEGERVHLSPPPLKKEVVPLKVVFQIYKRSK